MGLNQILREAFAADPNFWARLQGHGARFGAVSAPAGEATRRIDDGLRSLYDRLVTASTTWRRQQQEERAAIHALRAQQADVNERLTEFPRRLGWIQVNLEDALRVYPIVAAALAMIALFRLLHIVRQRPAAAGADRSAGAASRVGDSLPTGLRWSALLLGVVPLIATIHAAVAAITDRGLFTTTPGDPGRTLIGYGAAYAALILVGLSLLLAVTRGLVTMPLTRSAPPAADAGTGT